MTTATSILRLPVSLSGVAVVCCVHDREKRQVRDLDMVVRLGRELGREYDPRTDKLLLCACCENVFVDSDDTPKFCHRCRGPLVHPLGGPLPDPIGVVA